MVWIVNGVLLLLILLIVWWFWLFKPKAKSPAKPHGVVEIVVENGVYSPNAIEAQVGQTLQLQFIRKDPSHCAEQVIFPDFNVSKTLLVNEPTLLSLTPEKAGEFTFSCAMGMYQGRLLVRM